MEEINQKLTAIKDGLEQTIDQKIGQSIEKNMGDDFKAQLKGEVGELISKRDETISALNTRIDGMEMDRQKSLANAPASLRAITSA